MVIIASAPGKVILFGEHAVVYGKPAIAAAITKRIYVKSRLIDSGSGIQISSKGKTESTIEYVKRAIELVIGTKRMKKAKHGQGIEITIDSELPVGGGLGSSAALSVATIKSVSTLFGIDLEKEEIARLGKEVESKVQGASSGIDPFVSTYGGAIYYKDGRFSKCRQQINPFSGHGSIIIGYTGSPSSTKNMIANVSHLREKYPKIIDRIFDAIGDISERAKIILEEDNLNENENELGSLMNLNNGLLESLGVSSFSLSNLVNASLLAGALGAKITGAGGGGCIFALSSGEDWEDGEEKEVSTASNRSSRKSEIFEQFETRKSKICDAIKMAGGVPIPVEISHDGVRLESNSRKI
ncbi:MAG: Mevalonate kinase [Candidatus Methanolliviera sp. GoM_asphalt]|nr:MAG: Mevalonate kinase [Candidatus Methanolliviera sp. GoM_asphalt]